MTKKIVIFDGDCAFCNKSVLFILKRSRNNDIYVCSSQSDAGIQLIKQHSITVSPKATLIYLENNKAFIRSNAVLQLCKSLKWLYPLLFIFKIIPRPIRDGIYNFIAKRRKRIIKQDSCSFELASTYSDKVIT
jgi:predicted DCC family thiol-disulfide oxidoreductase YuxK